MIAGLLRAAQAVGVNAVPAGGFFLDGWSPATAIALYWLENLVGGILWALRIGVHARLTRKRGHILDPVETSPSRAGSPARRKRPAKQSNADPLAGGDLEPPPRSMHRYMVHYGAIALFFTLAQGIFVAIVLFGILKEKPDWARLEAGATILVGILLAGFLVDLTSLRRWPFLDLKNRAGATLGRVFVMHFTILGGMPLLALLGADAGFFGVFIGLKATVDLAGMLPWSGANADEAPHWLVRLLGRHGPDFARFWREGSVKERRYAERCEMVWDPAVRRWRSGDAPPADSGDPARAP
ncbi:MAG: hypothetical protein FJ148_19125 [Deltaproteobacteria bacterium]|nr:hypothetical protein [Deltaproteobacteria bacterium]